MNSNEDWLKSLSPENLGAALDRLSNDDADRLLRFWPLWARPEQTPPEGDWTVWLFLGGRGAGKTRAGAEWVAEAVAQGRARSIALIGETIADARDVMVEGRSGLIPNALDDEERPSLVQSRRCLTWPSGAQARLFSSEDPDSLRGHQFDLIWGDEFAKWRHPQETFDMAQFALRLGESPRMALTTTPKNMKALKRLMTDPQTFVTRGPSHANRANLSPAFFDAIVKRYEGTRLGRQELGGELIEDVQGALWRRDAIDLGRVSTPPVLERIVVAVDPPVTSSARADECGIVAAGRSADGALYVLADYSVQGLSPQAWANRALALYRALNAAAIIVETNQGGDLVHSLFRQLDPLARIEGVHASFGKRVRAEPVALAYERGRVHHVGAWPDLEDQMCAFGGEGSAAPDDRVDALVWAISTLMNADDAAPRMTRI